MRHDEGRAGRGAEWATDTNTSPNTHEAAAEVAAARAEAAAGIEPAVALRSKQHFCCSTNVQCTATSSSPR